MVLLYILKVVYGRYSIITSVIRDKEACHITRLYISKYQITKDIRYVNVTKFNINSAIYQPHRLSLIIPIVSLLYPSDTIVGTDAVIQKTRYSGRNSPRRQ